MAMYKYVNLNPFPIYVPTPEGTTRLFRSDPPESDTNAWFSRFCGPKQLTRMPIDVKIDMLMGTKPVKPEKFILDTVLEEETDDYTKKSGIYFCKHCETFRTGSSVLFKSHLDSYHKRAETIRMQDQMKEEGLAVPEVQPGTIGEAALIDSSTEALPSTKTEEAVGDVDSENNASVEVVPDKIFVCPESGCDKVFGSEHGLKIHVSRMHGEASSA